MNKTGVVPSLLFAFATFGSGTFASESIGRADTAAPKPAATAPKAVAAAPKLAPARAAPAPAVPSMPTPSKDLEAFMKGFEGSWKCETKFAAGSTGPGSPEANAKSAVKIKKEYEGFSWHGEYKLEKTSVMPAMSGVFQISYDPSSKHATFLSYDSMGAAMMGAGPISGDSVTFIEEGYMLGIKAKVRETMTKKSPREIHHKVEIEQGKAFQLLAEDACKK